MKYKDSSYQLFNLFVRYVEMLKGMKNVALVLFLLLFAACGSSSSDGGGGATLVGTWNLTGYNPGSGLIDASGSGITRVMTATDYTDFEPSVCNEVGTYATSGGVMTHTVTTATDLGGAGCDNADNDVWPLSYTVTATTFTLTYGSQVWVFTKV